MNLMRRFSSVLGLVILCVTLAIISPNFFSVGNFLSVLRQGVALSLVSIAMTFCIISGGIDLSVGSVMAFCGCVSALLMTSGMDWTLACLLGLALGAALGLSMGFFIAYVKLQPLVVTLVMMCIARGMALVLTNGVPVFGFPDEYRFLGTGFVFGFPFPVIIAMLAFAAAWFILKETRFGVNVYAVGGNMEAALYSGINVRRTQLAVYAISGALSGFAGIIMTSRLNSGQPILGEGIELDAIAAAVIGGTAMSGGQGGMMGTLIGTLIIILLHNGLNLLAISAFWQKVAIGVVILVAVLVDKFRYNVEGWSVKSRPAPKPGQDGRPA